MKGTIDITGADLVQVVQEVYNLSEPQGMGFLHYTPEPLTTAEAQALVMVNNERPVNLDYVKGRACKFMVFEYGGKYLINDSWFDHSKEDLVDLLERIGMSDRLAAA